MNAQMYVEITLMFCGVRTVRAFEVHVIRLPPRLEGPLALVCVLHVILEVLLPPESPFTELTLQVIFVHVLANFAF